MTSRELFKGWREELQGEHREAVVASPGEVQRLVRRPEHLLGSIDKIRELFEITSAVSRPPIDAQRVDHHIQRPRIAKCLALLWTRHLRYLRTRGAGTHPSTDASPHRSAYRWSAAQR